MMKRQHYFYAALILAVLIAVGSISQVNAQVPQTVKAAKRFSQQDSLWRRAGGVPLPAQMKSIPTTQSFLNPILVYLPGLELRADDIYARYQPVTNEDTVADSCAAKSSSSASLSTPILTEALINGYPYIDTRIFSYSFIYVNPFGGCGKCSQGPGVGAVSYTFTAPGKPGIYKYTKTTTVVNSGFKFGPATETIIDSGSLCVMDPKTGKFAENSSFPIIEMKPGTDSTIKNSYPYTKTYIRINVSPYYFGECSPELGYGVISTGTYSATPYPSPVSSEASLSISSATYTGIEINVPTFQPNEIDTVREIRTFHAPQKPGTYFVFEKRTFSETTPVGKRYNEGIYAYKILVKDKTAVTFYHEFDNEQLKSVKPGRTSISEFTSSGGAAISGNGDPKICADSSSSTIIKVENKNGQGRCDEFEYAMVPYAESSVFPRIKVGDPFNKDLGKLTIKSSSPDSVVFLYQHPSRLGSQSFGSGEYFFSVKDPKGEIGAPDSTVANEVVRLYPAPVAFFHGQWDNTSCFQQMKDSFVSDGWPKELLWLANYSPGRKGGGWNDAPFAVNIERGTVVMDINNALKAAIKAGYSAGKVSLVGHSYGGVLSRLYVQETPPATGGSFIKYRNDVNRVITIGSPHLGSQQGDDLYYGLTGGDARVQFKALIMGSIINQDVIYTATSGSLRDLRTESPVMRFLMNDPAGIERNKVPSSAIYTTASPCQLIEDAVEQNGFINVSLIFAYLENTINFLNNIPFVNLGDVIEGASTRAINKLISETFPSIFNGDESELSVSVGSALGNPPGSPAATFAAENVLHGKQPRDPAVIAKTKELLLEDPYTSTKFTKGFHPVPPPQFADPNASQYLYFDPAYKGKYPSPDTCLKEIPTSPSARSMQMAYAKTMAGKGMYGLSTSDVSSTITAPADNQTFAVGQSVTMQVQPQGAVAAQVFAVRYPNVAPADSSHIIMGFDPVGATTAFTFKVPDAAIGKAYLFACTLDSLGNYTSIDSAVINISVPTSVSSLQTYNSFYAIEVGDTTVLNLYGTFSDDVKRDITGLAGLSYTSSNPSVIEVLAEQVLVAKAIGTATITASYQSQQITTEAEVLPVTSSATSSVGGGNGDGGTTPKSGNALKSYSLSQNYPNPFNPATRISFSLPSAGLVKLKVYDVLGRVVKVLVDEKRDMGRYEVSFDASKLASGVYFYRLQSGNFTQSRKMILVK